MTDQQISKMTGEELDRAVAVEVMGWFGRGPFWCSDKELRYIVCVMEDISPSISPTDDYAVLVHVRETWDDQLIIAMRDKLYTKWEWEPGYRKVCGPTRYQPGDYAKSALATVREPHP